MQESDAIYSYTEGKPYPLGAHCRDGGVNFCVFSSAATAMELLLFQNSNDIEPFQIIMLNQRDNFEFGFWHVFVADLSPGIYYAFRVYGPEDNAQGHRFNSNKVLIDPYAKGISDDMWNRKNACNDSDNIATSMRGRIIDETNYDWEGVEKPNIPLKETIIYEMHVKGFTKSSTSGVKYPGTYAGIIEKIPYLKSLGITAIELMPIMHFDKTEPDFWGYNTIGFFAPHNAYCISPEGTSQLNEFRDMVKELHKNNLEVILDVVYNHTGEGNENGPTINFKGFDNNVYYSLDPSDKRYYINYSGCGNAFNCNHPIVQKLIIDSLEFWATKMQVDGFRFDLGTILTLDTHGNVLEYPPVLWEIELRETLIDCKLISEPWSGDGAERLYQLGNIHGNRWSQWNGNYRDCIRRYVKGDAGLISEVATRISGSPDLYESSGHLPASSINFISCHDGLTLNDLVSYSNQTQSSWNCGIEGETEDTDINQLRLRQIKNFVTILFLSKGIPMILAGDEIGRTQKGCDNGTQLDNELGWLNWDLYNKNAEIFKFFQRMINLRKQTYFLQSSHFYTGSWSEATDGISDVTWHGTTLNEPNLDDAAAKALAFTIVGVSIEDIPKIEEHEHMESFLDQDVHVMMNMSCDPLVFQIPQIENKDWFIYVDTYESENSENILHSQNTYTVRSRSIAVFVSKLKD